MSELVPVVWFKFGDISLEAALSKKSVKSVVRRFGDKVFAENFLSNAETLAINSKFIEANPNAKYEYGYGAIIYLVPDTEYDKAFSDIKNICTNLGVIDKFDTYYVGKKEILAHKEIELQYGESGFPEFPIKKQAKKCEKGNVL